METDSSGSIGYGAVLGPDWFDGTWDDAWWTSQNIVLLELYPIFAALHIWRHQISDSCLLIKTDNMALVSILTNSYSLY